MVLSNLHFDTLINQKKVNQLLEIHIRRPKIEKRREREKIGQSSLPFHLSTLIRSKFDVSTSSNHNKPLNVSFPFGEYIER
uniref:Uncharacterized protein n=1 Tax=Caenorhabditis tropicalis TaxID=1561998 RepID=A0A1I7TEN4_9PELO